MKRFTKIALITALLMAIFGVACILAAFSMGLSTEAFVQMVKNGEFSFPRGQLSEEEIREIEISSQQISRDFTSLDIEYGAGDIRIFYGDVDDVEVTQKGISTYGWMINDLTLCIEGSSSIKTGAEGYLEIILPRGKHLESIELSLGASKAEISDLVAESVSIEVGAGEAIVTNLDTQKLEAETGVGSLEIQLAGKEADYNYKVECGIGSIIIGKNSYSGFGALNDIENPGAMKNVDVECGIGQIELSFVE